MNKYTPNTTSSVIKSEKLLEIYCKNKSTNIRLRNEIVVLNYGLLREVVHRYSNKRGYQEDLEQVGSIGLIKAVEKFDIERECKFSCFARSCIEGEIKHYLRDYAPEIRFPRRWHEMYTKGQSFRAKILATENRTPTDVEIAEFVGINIEKWNKILDTKANIYPVSLNSKTGKDNLSLAEPRELIDTLRDHNEQILRQNREDLEVLYSAANSLDGLMRDAFIMVALQGKTRRLAAIELNVHHLTISRRLESAIIAIKKILQASI